MTTKEVEELLDETKRLARASDKVALNTAIAALEIARQLMLLNETLSGTPAKGNTKKKKKKK